MFEYFLHVSSSVTAFKPHIKLEKQKHAEWLREIEER